MGTLKLNSKLGLLAALAVVASAGACKTVKPEMVKKDKKPFKPERLLGLAWEQHYKAYTPPCHETARRSAAAAAAVGAWAPTAKHVSNIVGCTLPQASSAPGTWMP